ncbi:helix-turn-helix domain-containing protein [Lysinibacillus capsici]|nr:helix-turn-helix transcriptional regulator [Lysinibacillus capsici]
MELWKEFGVILMYYREKIKMSLQELADKTGISVPYLEVF